MFKTPSPEEVSIPLLLIVIIITSSSSDLCDLDIYLYIYHDIYRDIDIYQGTYPLLIIMSYSIMISSSGVQ